MQVSFAFQWNISDYFYQNQEKLCQSLSGDMTVFPDFPGTPNMPPFDKLWMCLYARLGEYSFPLMGSNHKCSVCGSKGIINPSTPNDPYSGRTALLTSKCCILYIYSTNIGTEYFKHRIYSPFLSLQNAVLFHNSNIFGSCFIHILFTVCAKIKKKIILVSNG